VKVYADHNVVAALVRQDQRPQENAATRVLKEWADDGRITLVVSVVHDREDAPPEQYRPQRTKPCPSSRRLSSRMIVGSTASTRCTAALVAGNTSGAVTHQFSFLAGRGRRLDVLSGCRTRSGRASSPISLVAAAAAQEMRRREPDVEAGTG
jgi:hypothetical protein